MKTSVTWGQCSLCTVEEIATLTTSYPLRDAREFLKIRDVKNLQDSFSQVSWLSAPLPPTRLTLSLDFPLPLHRSPSSSPASIMAAAAQQLKHHQKVTDSLAAYGKRKPCIQQPMTILWFFSVGFFESLNVSKPKEQEEARSFHLPWW